MSEQVFDSREVGLVEPVRRASGCGDVQHLRELAGKVAPVVLAGEQVVPVGEMVAPLLPGGGLRRGSVVSVDGPVGSGATSLLLHLVVGASLTGSWIAVIGLSSFGLVAASEAKVDLDRLAIVPEPGGNWPIVTAALLDAIDVVVLRPSTRVRAQDARRLAGRTRERGGILVVAGSWPEGADIRLTAQRSQWDGLEQGHGFLRARRIEVVADGRGAAARQRRAQVAV